MKYVLALVATALVWGIVYVLRLPWWLGLLFTLVAFGVAVALDVQRRRVARRAAQDIERALGAQADEHARSVRPEQQDEIRAMQSEFNKAVASLKSSSLGRSGVEALYALPWYMIIGPPGTGKSTALRNSGLEFPYLSAGGGAVRGVGGTRNCDWWLTNQAVLLDTAGRYTTDEEDRDEWFSFLDMLKRNRSRRPINGVLVAVSASDVGGAAEHDVTALAKRVRERIDEVSVRLQMTVPVYVLFTKCDLLPGFVEMFGDLRKNERGQVWGMTLPLDGSAASPRDRFVAGFDELATVVEQRALKRLAEERKQDVREKVFAFPQQFEILRDNLAEFVGTLFAPNVFQGTPMMRGAYFTSGTQEGRPIDRVMNAMASAFGVQAPSTFTNAPVIESKSYFLRDVFTNVVFPDQDQAARSTVELRRERNRRYALAGVALATAALLLVLPGNAYVQNRSLVHDLVSAADGAARHHAQRDTGPVHPNEIDPLRTQVELLTNYRDKGAPLSMRFGMFQGDELRPSAVALYAGTLQHDVVEPILTADAREMVALRTRATATGAAVTAEEYPRYYDLLKTHLLLTRPAELDQPALAGDTLAYAATQITSRWGARLRAGDAATARASMAANAAAYLSLLSADPQLSVARNTELVRNVRAVLLRAPLAELALEQIVRSVDADEYDLRLAGIVGSASTALRSNERVRGAFTRRAWEETVRGRIEHALTELVGEPWVLGQQLDRDRLAQRGAQLRSDYFGRYIEEWKHFLDSITLVEPTDPASALALLQDLTRGAPPPVGRLMRMVAYNTHLEEAPTPAGAAGSIAGQVAQAAQGGMVDAIRARLGGSAAAQQVAAAVGSQAAGLVPTARLAPNQLDRRSVETAFSGFASFGTPPPSAAPAAPDAPPPPPVAVPLDAYQEQLQFVRDSLVAFNENPTAGAAPLQTALQTARTRAQALIMAQEIGWRPRFQGLLWPPLDWTSRRASAAMATGTGSKWCSTVVVPYDRTLRNRYPFAADGHDAALADVADFFRPESGKLWQFYNDALRADVTREGENFAFAERLGASMADYYNPELLPFLSHAQDVSTVLFPPRGGEPLASFEIRVRPVPGIHTITLVVDGQRSEYSNGPEQWVAMRWPGTDGTRGASLRVRGEHGLDETITQDGEWGLMRLLELGRLQADAAARIFSVTWSIPAQDLEVTADVRPARSENPFLGVPRPGSHTQLLAAFRSGALALPRALPRAGRACDPAVDLQRPAPPARVRTASSALHTS